jgi:rubrerythrin
MNKDTATGKNRTGIDLSPIDKRELLEVTEMTVPSMEGDITVLDELRAEYINQGDAIGSLPPPATAKGVAGKVVDTVKGANVNVLLDKLGERLAFERTGTRLYEALAGKCEASDPLPGGPTVAELRQIQAEELDHFDVVRQVMIQLGADPTAVTPSADVVSVTSMGILQVISDPRMTLKQSLEAILVAELVDNAAWDLLIQLARAAGHDAIAKTFERPLADEQKHLVNVRKWVTQSTIGAATPMKAAKA